MTENTAASTDFGDGTSISMTNGPSNNFSTWQVSLDQMAGNNGVTSGTANANLYNIDGTTTGVTFQGGLWGNGNVTNVNNTASSVDTAYIQGSDGTLWVINYGSFSGLPSSYGAAAQQGLEVVKVNANPDLRRLTQSSR